LILTRRGGRNEERLRRNLLGERFGTIVDDQRYRRRRRMGQELANGAVGVRRGLLLVGGGLGRLMLEHIMMMSTAPTVRSEVAGSVRMHVPN